MQTATRSVRSRTRQIARVLTALSVMGIGTFAAGCSSDSISAPVAQTEYKSIRMPVGDIWKMLFPMEPLTRDSELSAPITRSFKIGKDGGKMEIKEAGLEVHVPKGAIAGGTITIKITALPGAAIAYDFQPHGTVFLKPLDFQQDLKKTSWDKLNFKGTVLGGYFANESQLDMMQGLALLDELLPVTLRSNTASFDIWHFSGYMVSGGRQGAYSESAF